MKSIRTSLRDFFYAPAGSPRWRILLPYAVLGLLTLVVLVAAAYGWDYTNSPSFCGTACHTMPPEYTAYLTSPHARIDCVDCHIGKGFIATKISRKAGDVRHVVAAVFKTYEYPIVAKDLRPARETCELCHSPEKFSNDTLVEIRHYAPDKDNTATATYLILKTGGGSKRLGLGKGIHWHIENPVYYLPTDTEEQNIPFVRVVNDDGTTTDYTELGSNINPATVKTGDLKEMDCITCHNRITHLVPQPEESVDRLMTNGVISSTIPEIRKRAVEALRASYSTTDEAMSGIAALADFYKTTYPNFYAQFPSLVTAAVTDIQAIYNQSVFPEQKSNWDSHPDNVGHVYSPGCFRCHDGKHLTSDNKAVRLECNLCHSIPIVAGPPDFLADIEISRGPEPGSHLNPNWISLHRDAFNPSCSNCHNTSNPGGTDNSSFCSNSACHGSTWKYAGFDAPGLREQILRTLPITPTPAAPPAPSTPPPAAALTYDAVIGPLFQSKCGVCHGASGQKGLNLTTYATAMAGGQDGAVIVAGDPTKSRLIQVQSGQHFAQFSPDELKLVTDWILAGAPEK